MALIRVIGESIVDVVKDSDATRDYAGGSPLNVAAGLARLGQRVEFLTRIGRDEGGQLLSSRLESDGVRLVDGSLVDGRTSTATATLDADGAASYVFDIDWSVPVTPLPPVDLVHFGSIAAFLEPGATAVRELVGASGEAIVTFDPNVRPLIAGGAAGLRPAFEQLAASCDILKLSDEDAHYLLSTDDLGMIVSELLRVGPPLVIVTLGAEGALLATEGSVEHVASLNVPVADTIGAGDSFMSGMIHALFDGVSPDRSALELAREPARLREIGRFATRCAAVTVSRPGANPPWLSEMRPVTPAV